MNLETLVGMLRARGVDFCLIGGVALAARGAGRSTIDLDLLTTNRALLDRKFWDEARSAGWVIDVRIGDIDDPLAGVVRVHASEPIDIVVGKYRWQSAVVARAEPVTIGETTLPVARAADLILLKLFAGGPRDLDDIRQLLATDAGERLVADVTPLLDELHADARARWERLLLER